MKGIAAIRGEKLPRIDQEYFYEVTSFYPGTVVSNDQDIKWKLFTQEESGRWRELRGTLKRGRRVSFKFPQQWYGKKLLVEAFINNPEIKTPPGMIVMPVPGQRSIKRITILDRNGQRFTKPPKYGQTIKVEIETVNMLGETLSVGLWERDTMSDTGHSAADNENIWGKDKTYKVTETNGMVTFSFVLDAAWAIKANRSLFEGSTHEYYLLVKGYGAGTKYSHQQEVTDAVVPAENNTTPQGAGAAPKQNRLPAQPAPTPQNPAPVPVQQQSTIPASGLGADPAPVAGGKSTTTVEDEKVEGLTDAYFAKKEFTKKTGETAATFEYEIKSNGNKTGTDAEKKKIAGIILNKAEVKALATKKEYTTEEAIIQALTKNVYNNGDKITFQTYKLGPEFRKIQSAPLEDKVYLVATGYLLDGKQATITIKEKDGILKGTPGAVLSVFEITEQQMDDPNAVITGTEKSTFTGMIQDGIVKIPVQLRPKDDEALKQWKEKLAKGKEDGTYTYTFNNEAGTLISADNKNRLAEIILGNAKGGLKDNPKIEAGKTSYAGEVEAVLETKTYNKGEQITFKLYKKIPELLYLQAQAQGEKQHDKEFLKKDGAYFELGKSKEIIFPLRVKPENDPGFKWGSGYYWAASQGANQATYNSGRGGGTRKHAGRDLYTNPETPVVAICKGEVLEVKGFYAQTDQVTVLHTTNDGRKFIIRYGELAPNSIKVKKGDPVAQGDQLGVTGHLVGITVISGQTVYMLHFEHYTGEKGYDLTTSLTTGDMPFLRRTDLVDSLAILQEGYRNTFESGEADDRVNPQTLTFSQNGLDFLKGYEQEIKKNGLHVTFDDDYGFCTIGYGHLIAGKQSCSNITIPAEFANGLTDEQANALLARDVLRISNLVKSKVTVNLYQYEFDALVSLAFNVEAAVGASSTLLRKLNEKDYEGAANEFKNWRMAGGVVSPGLVKRRAQETDIFKNNVYDSTH